MPQARLAATLTRLAREGQMTERTTWLGTPWQHTGMAPVVPLPPFRTYRWRERPRHPVISPAAAADDQPAGPR